MADAAALAATGAATAAPLPPGSPSDAPLSKRQKRRLANAARRAETKKARRAAEKEKKRLNTAARKEERAEELRGLGEEERQEVIRRRKEERLERVRAKQEQERRLSEAVTRGVRLAIDMRWADQQTDREMRSLSFQLSQAYASNRLSPDPCCIVLAGLSEGASCTRASACLHSPALPQSRLHALSLLTCALAFAILRPDHCHARACTQPRTRPSGR